MRRPSSFALIALACSGLLAGCGAAFDGTVYRGKGFAFRVPERPGSWEQIPAEGVALAYRDASANATIAVGGRCISGTDDVPLRSLTHHLFIRFTEQKVTTEETVPFDGREALHTVMTAKLDGVPKSFDVWVLKKDGCVYDLYLIAEPDKFERSVPEFRKFVDGFATVPIDDG